MKKMSVSIGIPTYEAGDHLIADLSSIYKQTALSFVKEILVIVDGNSLSQKIRKQIKHPKLRVITSKKREGQSSRLNDIFRIATGDLLILTNDDVILNRNCVKEFLNKQLASKADLIAGRVLPITPKSFFERILAAGKEIDSDISSRWNKGDNYLSCNGRLIALSKTYYKKLHIPVNLWNNDAYIYFEAKYKDCVFLRAPEAIAYYKIPGNFNDHLRQSLKFQMSKRENQHHFKQSVKELYTLPISLSTAATTQALKHQPILISAYLTLTVATRIWSIVQPSILPKKGYWHTDISTKNIGDNHE